MKNVEQPWYQRLVKLTLSPELSESDSYDITKALDALLSADLPKPMFGDNKDCPIRITSGFGLNRDQVEMYAQMLSNQFGWKVHSWAELKFYHHSELITVYSVLMFNPNTGIQDGTPNSTIISTNNSTKVISDDKLNPTEKDPNS